MAKKNREKLGKKPGKIEPHPKIINTTKHKRPHFSLFGGCRTTNQAINRSSCTGCFQFAATRPPSAGTGRAKKKKEQRSNTFEKEIDGRF